MFHHVFFYTPGRGQDNDLFEVIRKEQLIVVDVIWNVVATNSI